MIPLGSVLRKRDRIHTQNLSSRTLATDRGFKERVREDMLVRLLDAFVWKSHGSLLFLPRSQEVTHLLQIVMTLSDLGSHTCKE